ncbi:MAG: hypothetical protein KDE59_04485, partial [Anaerolineales bacterium]|nr:hypothetical protein [Anaerolineales bacterium]
LSGGWVVGDGVMRGRTVGVGTKVPDRRAMLLVGPAGVAAAAGVRVPVGKGAVGGVELVGVVVGVWVG